MGSFCFSFHCSYCGLNAPVEWAENEEEIIMTLSLRPIPHTRNWYPKKHPVALKFGLPDGQSIQELVQEARDHGVFTPERKAVI